MIDIEGLLISLLFLAIAFLYSSVGHAGASGYLGVMGLMATTPSVMRPTALILNALVAFVGTWNFWRSGWFRWRLFWPFACASIPAAWLGGAITLPDAYYTPLVGTVLIYVAMQLGLPRMEDSSTTHPPSVPVALITGMLLGFLSGLTGVGGGVFLSPLLVLARWSTVREASGVAAPFILVNSLAGLMGHYSPNLTLPPAVPFWIVAVFIGGATGSWLGSQRFSPLIVRRLLMVVLASAGTKMLWT